MITDEFDKYIRAERGRQKAVAEHCGVSHTAVQKWRKNGVALRFVPAVSEITGIPRHVLRPDFWDAPCIAA